MWTYGAGKIGGCIDGWMIWKKKTTFITFANYDEWDG